MKKILKGITYIKKILKGKTGIKNTPEEMIDIKNKPKEITIPENPPKEIQIPENPLKEIPRQEAPPKEIKMQEIPPKEIPKGMHNLTRRNIRYICFRIKDIEEGGAPSSSGGLMEYSDEVRLHMESQSDFGGWRNFAKTWDVDIKAFLVVVLRTSSIQSEWDQIVAKEAKDLPM